MNKKEFLANQANGFESLMTSNEVMADAEKAAKFAKSTVALAEAPKVGEEFEVLGYTGEMSSANTGICYGKFAVARGVDDDAEVLGITTTQLTRRGQRYTKSANTTPMTVPVNPTVLQNYPEDKFNLVPVYSLKHLNTPEFAARIQKAGKLILAGEEVIDVIYAGTAAKNSVQRWCIAEPKA